jgi:hypothetical protein
LHGGTLSIVSEPNTGAVIVAKFPKMKSEPVALAN